VDITILIKARWAAGAPRCPARDTRDGNAFLARMTPPGVGERGIHRDSADYFRSLSELSTNWLGVRISRTYCVSGIRRGPKSRLPCCSGAGVAPGPGPRLASTSC